MYQAQTENQPENGTGSEVMFQLVVIGASAGGIEALSRLVANLPVVFPVPLVIAQHLDPNRPSHLAQILSRLTTLPVLSVEQTLPLEPGTIYVVPANEHVAITDHEVTVLSNERGRPKPSVDLLLASAADVFGKKLIAVILTGAGSDGSLGAQAVHARGGTVVIQNPATAAYSGMPQSVLPETVALVADLPDIAALLSRLVNGLVSSPQASSRFSSANSANDTEITTVIKPELEAFLSSLLEQSGFDFRAYKPATLQRRLQRRLVATHSATLADYKVYLQTHSAEYTNLVSGFLIKVTEFMRDSELFTPLQMQILPELISYSRKHEKELRFWSAGCATGEEAYSLAILLSEALGAEIGDFHIKIFATDLDVNAVTYARRGIYPAKAFTKLPSKLLQRYFIPDGENYKVKKAIRDLVVFGIHDLAQRAPFPHIDLVLCRNVLIYFNQELQRHALELFAFALRNGGYLALGRAETPNQLVEYFTIHQSQQRLYQRTGQRLTPQPLGLGRKLNQPLSSLTHLPNSKATPNANAKGQARKPRKLMLNPNTRKLTRQSQIQSGQIVRDNLLLKLPIGVVIVDQHYDIQEINSAARRLLSIHTVAIGEDFVHLAQHIPSRSLASAINKAIREDVSTTLELVEVPHLTTGEASFLELVCHSYSQLPVARVKAKYDPENEFKNELENSIDEEARDSDNQSEARFNYALILITDATPQYQAEQELKLARLYQAQLSKELAQSSSNLQETKQELALVSPQLAQSKLALAEALERQGTLALQHKHQMELLLEANQELLVTNQALTDSIAKLRQENENYLLHTEEAQAAIEEAETLNEEAQATNEELETLNEELQSTVEELNTTNTDLATQTIELYQRTEELRAQEQQSERERNQLVALLTSMRDAVVVIDATGKLILTNPAYIETFQTKPELILLDEMGEYLLPAEGNPLTRAAQGETFSLIFSFVSSEAEDSLRWWEASGQPVQATQTGDSPWGLLVMRDITERSLRRLQERFLSLVGHELRTPLTVSKGYLGLVQNWLEQLANPNPNPKLVNSDFTKPTNYLKQMAMQSERLERLVSDLVDVGRLQNDKFNLQFTQINLSELLSHVVADARLLVDQSVPVIELTLADGLVETSLVVQGDKLRLEQVFLNLIKNALVHAASSPKIKIELSVKKGGGEMAGSQVAEVAIQDYGPGIKAANLPYLFSQFYQGESNNNGSEADVTTIANQDKPRDKGLGLGLYIAQGIVTAHGGKLAVRSVEGAGTVFTVLLPLVETV